MKLTRSEIFEVANNIDSLNMLDRVLVAEVVSELEGFIDNGQMDMVQPGDDRRQIESYASIKKPTGDVAHVRAYKDGTFDILDKDTFVKEFKFNFLPKRYKESLRAKLSEHTPKTALTQAETQQSGGIYQPNDRISEQP